MKRKIPKLHRVAFITALLPICLAAANAIAQAPSTPVKGTPAATMHKDMANMKPHEGGMAMHQSMMSGMDAMKKLPVTGDIDRDFAVMMRAHHQQGVDMAEMQIMHGKSADMKAMAKNIITAQKKEIAQFDKWLIKKSTP